ncbi:hypothetical protein GOODEAATRI_005868 [Goodea atripinnis]|uniref:Uncharacterized protein n=1 Tax=Goodea atripinnis TaxID=208336 RepID=A0ABV0PWC3_9TELE
MRLLLLLLRSKPGLQTVSPVYLIVSPSDVRLSKLKQNAQIRLCKIGPGVEHGEGAPGRSPVTPAADWSMLSDPFWSFFNSLIEVNVPACWLSPPCLMAAGFSDVHGNTHGAATEERS